MKNLKKSTRQGRPDLSLKQRQEIFRMNNGINTIQRIAECVKCSKSTVSDTLNHESLTQHNEHLHWSSKGKIVHEAVKKNRGRPKTRTCKLQRDLKLLDFVVSELKDKKSPKTIAYSIKDKFSDTILCAESIYFYIYHYDKSLIKYLVRYGRTKRNNRASGHKSRILEIQKRNIEQRPEMASSRIQALHAEGDCIVSCRGGASCLVVSVDRYNRKIWLRKIHNREAETLRKAYFSIMQEAGFKTLTLDNDPAHNSLPMLESVFKELQIYFCNPYSPWERGTVEAIIGVLRRWFPKGTNFDDISEEQVRYVENWFNNRHSEVLNGATPNQIAKAA